MGIGDRLKSQKLFCTYIFISIVIFISNPFEVFKNWDEYQYFTLLL